MKWIWKDMQAILFHQVELVLSLSFCAMPITIQKNSISCKYILDSLYMEITNF
jgi:hypothetical protein